MNPAGITCRLATPGDRVALGNFPCSSADVRLEDWIRRSALDRHLQASAVDDSRLLVFHDDNGELIAVAAHERNVWVADADGDPLPGTELKLVAISERFRDGHAPDGRALVAVVLEHTFEDITHCRRGDLVAMMVQPGNADGKRLVERSGATFVGVAAGDDVFILRLGTGG